MSHIHFNFLQSNFAGKHWHGQYGPTDFFHWCFGCIEHVKHRPHSFRYGLKSCNHANFESYFSRSIHSILTLPKHNTFSAQSRLGVQVQPSRFVTWLWWSKETKYCVQQASFRLAGFNNLWNPKRMIQSWMTT